MSCPYQDTDNVMIRPCWVIDLWLRKNVNFVFTLYLSIGKIPSRLKLSKKISKKTCEKKSQESQNNGTSNFCQTTYPLVWFCLTPLTLPKSDIIYERSLIASISSHFRQTAISISNIVVTTSTKRAEPTDPYNIKKQYIYTFIIFHISLIHLMTFMKYFGQNKK